MKKIFSKEVIIGITVLVSLAALFIGIDYLKGINIFRPSNYYYVKYTNVTGLAVSAPVTINGFQVGLVREINYDYSHNGNMKVELTLDEDLKIPKGSIATIENDLLGVASVKLVLSENNVFHEVGDYIEGKYAVGMMDNVSTKVMPTFEKMLPKIDSIVTGLNKIISNPALNNTITRLDQISSNIEKTTTVLNKMAVNKLPMTIDNINSITNNLDTITSNLTDLTATLKAEDVDAIVSNLNKTSNNIAQLTNNLNDSTSTVGALLNDRSLYDHLNTTLTNVDSILIDLRKNPKKYVNFKLF